MSALAAPYDPTLPTEEDFRSFSDTQPAPVSQAPPPKPSAGLDFDFDAFRAKAEQVGYAGLSQPERALIDQLAAGVAPSRENMAKTIMQEQARIREQSTPQAQAQAQSAKLSAEKTLLEKAKLEQEQIAKAKEQAELSARKSIVLSKIEKYTNPAAAGYVDIADLVGKWDGTAGAVLDAGGANDQRSAQRAELERLVNTDVLELTKFLKPVSQDELKFLKSMTPRLHQNDTIWKEYLLDAKSRLQPEPQATPQAAPDLTQGVISQPKQLPPVRISPGGQKLILNPDGRTYSVAK